MSTTGWLARTSYDRSKAFQPSQHAGASKPASQSASYRSTEQDDDLIFDFDSDDDEEQQTFKKTQQAASLLTFQADTTRPTVPFPSSDFTKPSWLSERERQETLSGSFGQESRSETSRFTGLTRTYSQTQKPLLAGRLPFEPGEETLPTRVRDQFREHFSKQTPEHRLKK